MSPDVRLQIELTTDAGDVEIPKASFTICHDPAGEEYACHSFIYVMKDGHAPEEIVPQLDSLGMRITHLYTVIPGGAVEVLHGTDADAYETLSALPNVDYVEYSRIVRAGDAPALELSAALPVNSSAVVTGNGALELQPGETVTARYKQPDGSVLTAMLRM
jgi:hypothetical protein